MNSKLSIENYGKTRTSQEVLSDLAGLFTKEAMAEVKNIALDAAAIGSVIAGCYAFFNFDWSNEAMHSTSSSVDALSALFLAVPMIALGARGRYYLAQKKEGPVSIMPSDKYQNPGPVSFPYKPQI